MRAAARRRAAPRLATLGLVAAFLAAQAPPAPAEDSKSPAAAPRARDEVTALAREKAERRARAAEAAGEGALLLVLSPANDGVSWSSRNPEYEYLSPVEAREAAVLVGRVRTPGTAGDERAAAKAAATLVDRLYLPVRRPGMELWTGPEVGPGPETAAAWAFADAPDLDRLVDDLRTLAPGVKTLLVSAGPPSVGGPALAKIVTKLRAALPGTAVRLPELVPGRGDPLSWLRDALARPADADPAATHAGSAAIDLAPAQQVLGPLREVKSASEIAAIRRAVAATVEGHADALRTARPGLFEYHLAAVFEMRCRAGGCRRQAYPSIVGSGPNSCVLHYERNRRELAKGDLVVLDAGGEYEGYACDVTRTFPVSGRFTQEQAKVYDAVLEAQEAALAQVRPGVTLRQVHEAARAVLEREGLAKWFPHGTCHSVGLEVHDPWRGEPLREGCVITVEPGVYDASRALGVRIEDTVVVTAKGCDVLSASLPKTRAGIEALMAEHAPAGLPR